MLMVSASFATAFPDYLYNGNYYKFDHVVSQDVLVPSQCNTTLANSNFTQWSPNSFSYPYFNVTFFYPPIKKLEYGGSSCYSANVIYTFYGTTSAPCPAGTTPTGGFCKVPTPTCTADQFLDTATNTCKPKCNSTGTYDANTGYCLDKSPIVSVQTTQNGSTVIKYADGGIMILFDGLGTTFDKDGNLVANRYYGGVIPSTASWNDLSFASSSNIAYNSLSLNGQPFLSFNAIGDALKIAAPYLAFPASFWMMALSDTKQQKNGDVLNFTPTSSNAVNVDLTTVNFDNIDFSEYAPSSGAVASVPNTDLSAQKIVRS